MTDLLDQAKPVRDSIIAEIARVLEDDIAAETRVGHQLGGHLVSVLIAFSSERHAHMRGEISDPDLMRVLIIAAAAVLTHCATGFRPIINGRPIPAAMNAQLLLQAIAHESFTAIAAIDAGTHDFAIPFERGEDGALKRQAFDVCDLLKGGA